MKSQTENRKGVVADPKTLVRICEIYESVQGEGLLTGTPSTFVRTSGCNLRCWFCDTRFASWEPEGQHLSVAEIDRRTRGFRASHIVLTGGEPMIYNNLGSLCDQLRSGDRHLTIETSGTVYQAVRCDLMSISPKLSGSAPKAGSPGWRRAHEQRRERLDIVLQLMREHDYQLKFVVDCPQDSLEVLEYLDRVAEYDSERVLLMPQGTDAGTLEKQAEWLIPWCREHGLRFCPRDHISWFGNQRGT